MCHYGIQAFISFRIKLRINREIGRWSIQTFGYSFDKFFSGLIGEGIIGSLLYTNSTKSLLAQVFTTSRARAVCGIHSYMIRKASGKAIDMIIDVEPEELAMDIPFDEKLQVLDVRKVAEYDAGHIKDAQNIPLNELMNPFNMSQVDEEANLYVHCAGGYRSVIACSLLKREGFHNLRNVLGGYGKMSKVERMPVVLPEKAS